MNFKLAAFADEADNRLEKQIDAMQRNGIEYLEIRGVDGETVTDITLEKAREIRKKLDLSNLSVWSVGSPFGKIGIDDDFAPHLEKFKRSLEISDILGATKMRMFSFYVPKENPEQYSDEVMSRLEQFQTAAKNSDVLLCHENEKGIYGDIAPRCEEIHKNFSSIKAVFDPANFIQCGQDTRAAWKILSPFVEYLHIKDALANGSVVPAGKGVGNIAYILENYRGTILTIEPHLTVFSGFEKLEQESDRTEGNYRYSSSEEAFDAAVTALKNLIH